MTLSEKLQDLRRDAGLSQEEVAGRLFVSRQSVSKWENGQAEPGVENLKALADLYGVTLDELTGREIPRRGEPEKFGAPESDEGEEQGSSFYGGVFAARTVTFIVLELMLLQGGIKVPFDWLAMLVGLFVRRVPVWWIVQVFLWINVAVNLLNMFQRSAVGAVGLFHTGIFLYLFFRPEVKDHFHLTEKEGTL